MRRMRAFLARAFVLLALASPIIPASSSAAEAQQPGKVYRIGILCPTQCVPTHPLWEPLIHGLRDFGWVEGHNFGFEFRHARGQSEQFARLATELVSTTPDMLVAPSESAAQALEDATREIPIVFVGVGDPVYRGFVGSLARPDGNMTGLTVIAAPGISTKRLELLRHAVPKASRIAVLLDPWGEPGSLASLQALDAAAKPFGLAIVHIDVRQPNDLEPAVATAARQGAGALLVLASPMITAQGARIGEAAVRHRLPAMTFTSLTSTGYVLSYGPSFAQLFRRVGFYVDKILRGAKPADLPVEQPTAFELVVNLKTEAAIGLTIPQSLLLRADKVIQ